ncbi:MAG: hypothetical protein AMS22_01435 [Thiotrichales bacterium SG8_50]|nr:MAG: hypothetical protein AMS22_01435 [Thiotrichales bacterium SG8_50]
MIDFLTFQTTVARIGLACVLCLGVVEAIRALRSPDEWRLHGIARCPGVTLVSRRLPLLTASALFFVATGCFVLKVQPFLSALSMAAIFLVLVSLYHSLPWSGYYEADDHGSPVRHIYHHLHLAGVCALGAAANESVALVAGVPRTRLSAVDVADISFVNVMWVCIGSHYFIAGLTKLRRRGRGWVDRRLFPFYIALLRTYRLGDSGRNGTDSLSSLILSRPRFGLLLLWMALACELSGVLYPFCGPMARMAIGAGLIGFHVVSRYVLFIDFRENLIMLITFSFLVVPQTGLSLGCAAFAAIVAASFLLGERLYPFSVLGMFTSPFRPATVLFFVDGESGNVIPTSALIDGTTSGVSREMQMYLSKGGTVREFAKTIEKRVALVGRGLRSAPIGAIVRTISVRDDGHVESEEDRYPDCFGKVVGVPTQITAASNA